MTDRGRKNDDTKVNIDKKIIEKIKTFPDDLRRPNVNIKFEMTSIANPRKKTYNQKDGRLTCG